MTLRTNKRRCLRFYFAEAELSVAHGLLTLNVSLISA